MLLSNANPGATNYMEQNAKDPWGIERMLKDSVEECNATRIFDFGQALINDSSTPQWAAKRHSLVGGIHGYPSPTSSILSSSGETYLFPFAQSIPMLNHAAAFTEDSIIDYPRRSSLNVARAPPNPNNSDSLMRRASVGGRIHHQKPRAATTASSNMYKCTKPYCTKVYKNPNGLRYHQDTGNCELDATTSLLSGTAELLDLQRKDVKITARPFFCRINGCAKKYKNVNGLKYHAKTLHPELDFEMCVKGCLRNFHPY